MGKERWASQARRGERWGKTTGKYLLQARPPASDSHVGDRIAFRLGVTRLNPPA